MGCVRPLRHLYGYANGYRRPDIVDGWMDGARMDVPLDTK